MHWSRQSDVRMLGGAGESMFSEFSPLMSQNREEFGGYDLLGCILSPSAVKNCSMSTSFLALISTSEFFSHSYHFWKDRHFP